MRLRPVLALLAVVALTQGIAPAFGFYTLAAFLWTVLALVLALAACTLPGWRWSFSSPWGTGILVAALLALGVQAGVEAWRQQDTLALGLCLAALAGAAAVLVWCRPGSAGLALSAGAAFLLAGQGVLWAQLFYVDHPLGLTLVRGAALAGFLALLSLLPDVHSFPSPQPGFRARVLLLFLTGALLHGGVLAASPDPVIDVYSWLRAAPDYLLLGKNPYAQDYPSPYGTERARQYDVPLPLERRPAAYPPLPIVLALPFRAAGLDARWANVVCYLLAALVLFLAGRDRGNPLAGALLAGAYLHLPRAPFLIEQAWYEPMLAATLGGGLLLVERRRPWGYLLVALGLTGKQFGLVLLPSLWRARRDEWRALLLALGVVLAALLLPFFLWGPADFLSIILTRHLARPVDYASLTVQSAVRAELHRELSPWVPLLVGGLMIAGLAWRTPRQGTGAGLWLGTALCVFCLSHTQGYFNYYHLCLYLWLLGAVGGLPDGAEEVPVLAKQASEPCAPTSGGVLPCAGK